MGYETKLIIGVPTDFISDLKEGFWFNKYAEIDLCKMGSDAHISNIPNKFNQGTIPYYYFADDGDRTIDEDKYGDKLKPIPVKTVVDALSKDVREDKYRRFVWALKLLKEMVKDSENICVMFYGH